jgi:hypothetical protein
VEDAALQVFARENVIAPSITARYSVDWRSVYQGADESGEGVVDVTLAASSMANDRRRSRFHRR